MKKFILSLFIFIFLIGGYNSDASSYAQKCGCCGKGEYVYQNNNWILSGCLCAGPKGSIVALCGSCMKCVDIHCKCGSSDGDQGSQSNQGTTNEHVCSFVQTCNKTHCDTLICSCGRHKNDKACGGGCNSSGSCSHCKVTFCSICKNHTCTHDTKGYCSKPHCTDNVYCSRCVHTCDGDHKFMNNCTEAHCARKICSVSGCGVHDGICGGGHKGENWQSSNGIHSLRCNIMNCNQVISSHTPVWSTANENHMSSCQKCTISEGHTPKWSNFVDTGMTHRRTCTVSIGGSRCPATVSHPANNWTWQAKQAEHNSSESGEIHIQVCTYPGCIITGDWHEWSDNNKWYKTSSEQHTRTCSTCSLTQSRAHDFPNKEIKTDDIEYHYKVCRCLDNDSNYKVLEKHTDADENTDGKGNGYCDDCSKELWRVTISEFNPDTESIDIKVEMFSDYSDKIIFPTKMSYLGNRDVVSESGVYTVYDNTNKDDDESIYIFYFEEPNHEVEVEISDISKIQVAFEKDPPYATTGTVKLKIVARDENGNPIDLRGPGKAWNENVKMVNNGEYTFYEFSMDVSKNGTYVFEIRNSYGKVIKKEEPIDNIVSGFGSVTTTFDTFPNGSIFTHVLVNINNKWTSTAAIENCLKSSVSVYKVDGGETEPINVELKPIEITDKNGDVVTGNILKNGFYYVEVSIGGKGVFASEGTYMVEINETEIKRNSTDTDPLLLIGKNRIEVVVQPFNDLT